jgi:hypothetical protein
VNVEGIKTKHLLIGAAVVVGFMFWRRSQEEAAEREAAMLEAQSASRRSGGSSWAGAIGNLGAGIGGLIDAATAFSENEGREGSTRA